jgi:hypothetical protein
MSSSDKRIKKNINDLSTLYSLEKIRQIQPRTYNFIDNVSYGNKLVYGFIAQETSNIIPECISLQSQFIPNIYTNALYNNKNITLIDKNTSCIDTNNKTIKLVTHDNDALFVTLDEIIDMYNFTIKETVNYTNVFVYGQFTEDFYVLEKETIFTLTTGAVKALDIENQELKNKVNNLESLVYDLNKRLQILESKV